ncbi:protein kinase family protein [Streptacidiphilus jiangxiensis]|uniref:Serine/threonine protein kinase n=1 Tax=Streptacidiphilus jiangxiensis TaxID=235985 RepID=A0A1H7JER5_STRJI|nr:protein kinase family protein [Streptacidiphilus jiangxiensis]SEK71875.1 Serine/threonine protein kinase [Streptacidiphilus jiangxiensis]
MSVEALATELDAEPEAPATPPATASAPAPADAAPDADAEQAAAAAARAVAESIAATSDADETDADADADAVGKDEADAGVVQPTADAGNESDDAPADEAPAAAATTADEASVAEASVAAGSAGDGASAGDVATRAAKGEAATAASEKPAATTATVKLTVAKAAAPAAADDADSDADADAEPAVEAASVEAPVRHSGDRIARRYRLEECTTSTEVFSSWRAVDEKLRRAVGIHLLAAAHPRAKRVLAAARQAALLGDPRFVQVLDAVEDGDVVYVVREWLPDATGLDTLLLTEPLEAYEAYQLVRQLAEALTAAHRRGLAHLRLTPASVLRTDSGQYRIDGIAVNAALRGVTADDTADAAQQDTRAIGALLFAGLTHRWPFAEGGNGLQRLPRDLGVVPAEQIRAGVHRGLSDLTARTLCTPPGGRLTPITTPADLAKAIAELPKVRQPEPEPLVLPSYPDHRTADRRGPATAAPSATPTVPPRTPQRPPMAPQPALPGRSGRALKWAVSLVVLGAIALGSWGTAEALMAKPGNGDTPQQSQGTSGSPAPGTGTRTLKTLPLSSATEFSPLDPTTIKGDQAPLAIDNNPKTAWITSSYIGYPNFGNYPTRKDGSGIVVDLGSVQSVSEVKVLLPFGGQTQEILAAPADAGSVPLDLSAFTQRISNDQLLAGTALDSGVLAKPVRTRYVLIHVTSLPADSTSPDHYRGGISEIQVLG